MNRLGPWCFRKARNRFMIRLKNERVHRDGDPDRERDRHCNQRYAAPQGRVIRLVIGIMITVARVMVIGPVIALRGTRMGAVMPLVVAVGMAVMGAGRGVGLIAIIGRCVTRTCMVLISRVGTLLGLRAPMMIALVRPMIGVLMTISGLVIAIIPRPPKRILIGRSGLISEIE